MIKKYLKIYRIFINNGISYVAQYRKDSWINFSIHILRLGMFLVIVEVIFGQTKALAGWGKHEVYLLVLFWNLVDELYVIIFAANLQRISDVVTEGRLDVLITKPVSSLFMVSTNFFVFRGVYRFGIDIILLVLLLVSYDFNISLLGIVLLPFFLICSVLILYSITMILNTMSFWLFRIDNINDAMKSLNTAGRYPMGVFPSFIKIIFLTAVPIGLIGYVPTAIMLEHWPIYGFLFLIFMTVIFLIMAIKFWNFAIQRYSSASS